MGDTISRMTANVRPSRRGYAGNIVTHCHLSPKGDLSWDKYAQEQTFCEAARDSGKAVREPTGQTPA